MTRAEAIANDPRVTVAARVFMFATPVVVVIGLTVIGWTINSQAAARVALEARVSNVENFDGAINSRVSVLESLKPNRDLQISAINARIDGNQNAVDAKLDKLQDTVSGLAGDIRALNATLTATAKRP